MAVDKTLYSSHSLEKTNSETSGSYTYWSDNPVSNLDIGDTFRPIAGSPLLNVNKIDISDEVIGEKNGKLQRQWQIRIEGSTEEQGDGSSTNVTYDFTVNKTEKTGSMKVEQKGNSPSITISVGESFNVPYIGSVTCTDVKGSSNYDSKGVKVWTVTYEGSSANDDEGEEPVDTNVRYSISSSADEIIGTKEVINTGNSASVSHSVGDSFSIPNFGSFKCTNVRVSNSFNDKGIQTWTVTYEGIRTSGSGESGDDDPDPTIPENESSVTYELNGITVRTVAGELLVLQRSANNAMRKTLTVYNNSENPLATIGSTYQGGGGIALSENIIKETIKKNGVTVSTYYKHTIEVES